MRHGERFMDNMDVLIDEFLQRLAHELKRKGHLTEIDGKFSQAELTAVSLPMGNDLPVNPNRRIQEFQTRLRPILLNLLKEQRPRNEITNYQLVLTKLELRMRRSG